MKSRAKERESSRERRVKRRLNPNGRDAVTARRCTNDWQKEKRAENPEKFRAKDKATYGRIKADPVRWERKKAVINAASRARRARAASPSSVSASDGHEDSDE